jgi:hypothetical protein
MAYFPLLRQGDSCWFSKSASLSVIATGTISWKKRGWMIETIQPQIASKALLEILAARPGNSFETPVFSRRS